MANIYSVTDGGDYNWNDTAAWSGGVVPGISDTAFIRHTFTQLNESSGVHYWTGSRDSIRVDSTSNLPDSGSFYAYLYPGGEQLKIDYDSKDSTFLYTCSVDHSYHSWSNALSGSTFIDADNQAGIGVLRNDTRIHSKSTTIYITGSQSVHANQIVVEDHAKFVVKDQATLYLNSSAADSRIFVRDGILNVLDEVTVYKTGSTERGGSTFIYHQNFPNSIIKVSGSSDLRTRTQLTSTSAIGSGKIAVADSSSFAVGDIISVYDEFGDTELHISLGTNNLAYDQYRYSETGSIWATEGVKKVKDEDETFYVCGISNGYLHVSKPFGKTGEIIDTTSLTLGKYQRQHGRSKTRFTGNKTTIQVRSVHNDFKAGDTVNINGELYTILTAADKLIPYKTVDFSQGDSLHEHFIVDEFIGSGSSIGFQANSHYVTGSSLKQDVNDVGSNLYYRSWFLKDTKLRDVKVTLSGSIIDDTDDAFSTNGMAGVTIREELGQRDRVLPFYGRYDYSRGSFIGLFGYNLYYGIDNDRYQRIDTRNITAFNTTSAQEAPFEVTIDGLREYTKTYYNGNFLNSHISAPRTGGIGIHLRGRQPNISKLTVEEYVQELVLDTSDSILTGHTVYEAGTKLNHSTGQKVVKLLSKISNLRGYKDLFGEYENGNVSGSSIPIFWSNNNGNKTLYRNSSTNTDQSRSDVLFKHTPRNQYMRITPDNNAYHDFNLGKSFTFDAIGLNHYYGGAAYNNSSLKNIGFEVSNDGYNWTEIKAQANDTRLSTYAYGLRMYDVTESTARFLRVRVGGASNTGRNYVSRLTLHHFDGRGNTIELNNTSDIDVGDTIVFYHPRGVDRLGTTPYLLDNWRTAAKNGTASQSDYVHGFYKHFQVTAKTGNVITTDRRIEGEYLREDTYVAKINRAITVDTLDYTPAGFYYSDNGTHIASTFIANAAGMALGDSNSEQLFLNRYPAGNEMNLLNCSLYHIDPDSDNAGAGHLRFKNNYFGNFLTFALSSNRNNPTSVFHGNIVDCQTYYYSVYTGTTNYSTGNLFSGRYLNMRISYSYVTKQGKNIFRNNHSVFTDYWNFYSISPFAETNPNEFSFKDNTFSNPNGYYRLGNEFTTTFKDSSKSNWPQLYPYEHTMGADWRNHLNFQAYWGANTDRRQPLVLYNYPEFNGRTGLMYSDHFITLEGENKGEYDVHNIYTYNTGRALNSCMFEVKSQQDIRVFVDLDYYMPEGTFENNHIRSNDRDALRVLLLNDLDRTVTSKVFSRHTSFSRETFDHTFTATPGVYTVLLNMPSLAIGSKFFTFRDMNCRITGETPEDINIYYNGFYDHKLIDNPEKTTISTLSKEGHEVIKKQTGDNPRTTVRFRKIRF